MYEDDISYMILITEGVHDLMVLGRMLKLQGFTEVVDIDRLPREIANLVPNKYPFGLNGNIITWMVPCPTFFTRGNLCCIIKQVGGGGARLASESKQILLALGVSAISKIQTIAFLLDADNVDPADKVSQLCGRLRETFDKERDYRFGDIDKGNIQLYDRSVHALFYVFPDNESNGTLEQLLMEGAEYSYPELLTPAKEYIEHIPPQYQEKWKPYDYMKATIGVITNVLKPGKANQVSIHDNDWITDDSVAQLETHKKLSSFLEEMFSDTTVQS